MKITPTEIRRLPGAGIKVSWSNGLVHELSSTALRTNCPCATCREDRGDTSHARPISTDAAPQKKRSMLTVIEHTATEQLNLTEIWGIGNYALGQMDTAPAYTRLSIFMSWGQLSSKTLELFNSTIQRKCLDFDPAVMSQEL